MGKLEWWIENLNCFNARYLIQAKSEIVIKTDASLQGWGANYMRIRTGDKWSVKERKLHILKLLFVKNGITAFTKTRTINAIRKAAACRCSSK